MVPVENALNLSSIHGQVEHLPDRRCPGRRAGFGRVPAISDLQTHRTSRPINVDKGNAGQSSGRALMGDGLTVKIGSQPGSAITPY